MHGGQDRRWTHRQETWFKGHVKRTRTQLEKTWTSSNCCPSWLYLYDLVSDDEELIWIYNARREIDAGLDTCFVCIDIIYRVFESCCQPSPKPQRGSELSGGWWVGLFISWVNSKVWLSPVSVLYRTVPVRPGPFKREFSLPLLLVRGG